MSEKVVEKAAARSEDDAGGDGLPTDEDEYDFDNDSEGNISDDPVDAADEDLVEASGSSEKVAKRADKENRKRERKESSRDKPTKKKKRTLSRFLDIEAGEGDEDEDEGDDFNGESREVKKNVDYLKQKSSVKVYRTEEELLRHFEEAYGRDDDREIDVRTGKVLVKRKKVPGASVGASSATGAGQKQSAAVAAPAKRPAPKVAEAASRDQDEDEEEDEDLSRARANVANELTGDLDVESEDEMVEAEDQDEEEDEIAFGADYDAYGRRSTVVMRGIPKGAKLFMVKCRIGHEREAVKQIMDRYVGRLGTQAPLLINSVVQRDHIKAYIYVEADNESHVKAAIEGVAIINPRSIAMVKEEDMARILHVVSQSTSVQPGAFVRVRRGVYKNDLGQVLDVHPESDSLTVRIVPRLDLDEIAEAKVIGTSMSKKKKKSSALRPPQRKFDAEQVRQHVRAGSAIAEPFTKRLDGKTYNIFMGQKFLGGFLIKTINMQALQVVDVQPSIDELAQFPAESTKSFSATSRENVSQGKGADRSMDLKKGEVVRVAEGDMQNLIAVVVQWVSKDTVEIAPKDKTLKLPSLIRANASQLQKFFVVSDRVRVIRGIHTGVTGLVTHVAGVRVRLVPDTDVSQELSVFAKDIELAELAELKTGSSALPAGAAAAPSSGSAATKQIFNFAIEDPVRIDADTVGIVLSADQDAYAVLDSSGRTRRLRGAELGQPLLPDASKRKVKCPHAADHFSNKISASDVVRIGAGPHRGQLATILWIHHNTAFCKETSIAVGTKGVIYVVRTEDVQLVGGRVTLDSLSTLRGQGASAMGNDRDPLFRKRVRIVGGCHKGLQGRVLFASEEKVRIEVESRTGPPLEVLKKDVRELTFNGDGLQTSTPNTYGNISQGGAAGYGPAAGSLAGYGTGSQGYGSQYDAFAQSQRSMGGATPFHPSSSASGMASALSQATYAPTPVSGSTAIGSMTAPTGYYSQTYNSATGIYAQSQTPAAGYASGYNTYAQSHTPAPSSFYAETPAPTQQMSIPPVNTYLQGVEVSLGDGRTAVVREVVPEEGSYRIQLLDSRGMYGGEIMSVRGDSVLLTAPRVRGSVKVIAGSEGVGRTMRYEGPLPNDDQKLILLDGNNYVFMPAGLIGNYVA
eukprot:ANDGO_08112.mRNA.1 Transcription elongation factor SPT5